MEGMGNMKIKMVWAAIVAFIMGLIAFVVGKRTPQVMASQLRANRARAEKLEADLRRAVEKQAQGEAVANRELDHVREAKQRIAKLNADADTITSRWRTNGKASDDAFAHAFNDRRRASSSRR